MGLRSLLLFGLGILYGLMIVSFQDRHKLGRLQMDEISQSTASHVPFIAFWGVAGIALGALLPWFDGVWESVFGQDDQFESATEHAISSEEDEEDQATDWGLAIRGIGAFVGIVFAIVS